MLNDEPITAESIFAEAFAPDDDELVSAQWCIVENGRQSEWDDLRIGGELAFTRRRLRYRLVMAGWTISNETPSHIETRGSTRGRYLQVKVYPVKNGN